jgi:hypothetical protein
MVMKVCLTLNEEIKLRVLRRVFRARREAVAGTWIKLHYEELHSLCRVSMLIKLQEDAVGRAFSTHV